MKRFFSPPYIVGYVLALFCIAVFVIADRGYANYSINHELDPVNVVTLAVNIFIAFFLQYYFASRAADDRAEKDILLDNVRDVFGMLRSCRDEVMSCHGVAKVSQESQQTIIKLYRTLSNGLENLQNAIEMSGCSTKLEADCEAVQKGFFDYKAAATGKFPYDSSDISYQERTYRALVRELHSLAFRVNKHR
jgi:hypothetical protein